MWLHQPPERRRKAGLRWWKPFIDLAGQYRACAALRAYSKALRYKEWIERFDRLSEPDRRRIRQRIAAMWPRPHFGVVICGGDGEARARTEASLQAQLYPHFSVVDGAGPFRPDEYVSVLRAGDRLSEHALYWMAETLSARDIAFAYADEDTMDEKGERSAPRFKPDWSPEHLRSINYVGRWAVIRGRELAAAGGLGALAVGDDGHDLNLRVARCVAREQVAHVPAVLYHRAAAHPAPRPAPRVRHPLPADLPLVSIIVPTRDCAHLLRGCIESVRAKSSYRAYEIIVVDNQSREPAALEYLRELEHGGQARVLRFDRPFNYSAINNLGARHARGEVLVLLNNDTEVITADWLEEMLGHLYREGVGVVGAKLLFGDGRVQHAGDAVGPGGCADHLHVGIPAEAGGYCDRAIVAQEVSAVTGACLMTFASLYRRLGGLDARNVPIAFSDVDFCLRVQELGYRVVFTPHARLYHLESASRGKDLTAAQRARTDSAASNMRRRWGRRMRHDPFYNPNLSYQQTDFSLSYAPRVKRPWT
jgi:GT2 family glycosyltransferase